MVDETLETRVEGQGSTTCEEFDKQERREIKPPHYNETGASFHLAVITAGAFMLTDETMRNGGYLLIAIPPFIHAISRIYGGASYGISRIYRKIRGSHSS